MKNQYIIPSLRHSISILELIAEYNQGLTLAEINKLVETPKATIYRILSTLQHEDVIEKKDDRYHIGFRLMKVGMLALSKLDIRNIATPFMHDLSIQLKETVHLAVLSDNKSLIIEVCDSPDPVMITSRAGTTVGLNCSATGKVFIAYAIGEDKIRNFLTNQVLEQRTGNTITSIDELINEVKKIKKNGYAFDNEEYFEGVRCLAVPITDISGKTIAAIGITGTSFRFKINLVESIAREVVATAIKISKKFGG